jgi:phosphoglycolate phosphatase-like HAD superfamily hydrolase
VPPADVVSVGDAPSDVTAARSVGIVSVAAGWASTTDVAVLAAAAPDHLFHTVDELADWLRDR